MTEHDGLFEKLEASGYLRREKQMYRIAQRLGFSATALERRCKKFSGGWQMRIALAKALLIVSHDRYFLDSLVSAVYELFFGRLKRYTGNYSTYEKIHVQEAGERLVCVGPNGAGKSTLLRILAGVDGDYSGKVRLGTDVKAGYFSQDASERLRGRQTLLDYLTERAPGENRSRLRDMLGAFLFRGDDVFKNLDALSGGEKSRLALLELLLSPCNLLIMDEPTNHLDMYSKDILLDALSSWKGAAVFVSHDRSFMEALSTKTLELRAGSAPRLFHGNYRYYLEKTAWESASADGGRGEGGVGGSSGTNRRTGEGGGGNYIIITT